MYTDVDTVWLEDPIKYLHGEYDLWMQSDADSPNDHPLHMLCTVMTLSAKPWLIDVTCIRALCDSVLMRL